jgi:hypothetical protein
LIDAQRIWRDHYYYHRAGRKANLRRERRQAIMLGRRKPYLFTYAVADLTNAYTANNVVSSTQHTRNRSAGENAGAEHAARRHMLGFACRI